jgi:hypothetical protein
LAIVKNNREEEERFQSRGLNAIVTEDKSQLSARDYLDLK